MRAFVKAIALACGTGMTLAGGGCAAPAAQTAPQDQAMANLLDYVASQRSTGFIVMRGGSVIVDKRWPAPQLPGFAPFLHGTNGDGVLLEDVASLQKSVIAVLMGVAIDRDLIDIDRPVSDYLGKGWSKADEEQEAQILVRHVLQMNTGLNEDFVYAHPAGTTFFYNTAVFATTKLLLTRVSGLPLDRLTRDWLTEPAGMADTAWMKRPPALGNVGNATGLVTTPADLARFGEVVLAGGIAPDGTRIVSRASVNAMLQRSPTNPAYGRLWWLNGSEYTTRGDGRKRTGPLIAAAPADLVGAFGFLDRRLYIVPGLDLIVVRTGAAAPDRDFDEQLWRRIMPAIS